MALEGDRGLGGVPRQVESASARPKTGQALPGITPGEEALGVRETSDAAGTQWDLPASPGEPKGLQGNVSKQGQEPCVQDRTVLGAVPVSPLPGDFWPVFPFRSSRSSGLQEPELSVDGASSKSNTRLRPRLRSPGKPPRLSAETTQTAALQKAGSDSTLGKKHPKNSKTGGTGNSRASSPVPVRCEGTKDAR